MKRLVFGKVVLMVMAFGSPAHAGPFWKELKEEFDKIPPPPFIPQVIKIIPAQETIDALRGKSSPEEAVRNYIRTQGESIGTVTNVTRSVTGTVDQSFAQAAQSIGGDFGRTVYEIGTGGERIQREFLFTAANSAGNVLQGQDPLVSLAMPLAAAIRDARSKFDRQAQPLPENLVRMLAPYVPQDVLHRARYARGDLKISLPSVINTGQTMFSGAQHAVTVDDIIVFSRVPGTTDIDDIQWWAHEIHHVHQYKQWGVDSFAFRYIKHHGQVEAEADRSATIVSSYIEQSKGRQVISSQVPFAAAQSFQPVAVQTPLGVSEVYVRSAQVIRPAVVRTDRCVINGEDVIIGSDNSVWSFTRNGQSVATRVQSNMPNCVFELIPTGFAGRICVDNTGLVWVPNAAFPVGQCLPCSVTQC